MLLRGAESGLSRTGLELRHEERIQKIGQWYRPIPWHQCGVIAGGSYTLPYAGTTAPRVLATRGLVTASAPSDWNIPRSALRMQRALIDGIADAARNARPGRAIAITAWQEARLRQALMGRLAITIGHRDILALPSGG